MGLLDYIPVVATVKHAFFDDPKGRTVADYDECKATVVGCETKGSDLAVADCERCIDGKFVGFLGALLGENLLSDLIRGVVGAGVVGFGARILGALGVRLGARGALAATGIGVVFVADAVIDAGITLSRASEIRDAAAQAKTDLCRCPPP